MKPAAIDEDFRTAAMNAMEEFLEYRAAVAPFGGGMMKKMGKFGLKWVKKYLDQIAALPIVLQTCANCDAVINTGTFIDVGSSSATGT